MTFTELVELTKKENKIKNIEEVQNNIESDWVQEKIKNYLTSINNFISKSEVENAIQNSFIVASFSAKDPNKQNIPEKLIESILGLTKLPSQGKNYIRFDDNGDIQTKSLGNTKTADFKYQDYYITQKYTAENGGSQDNQRNDVIDFLKRGFIKHKVIALVDGPYWESKYKNILKDMFKDNSNVKVLSVDEFKEEMNE